MKENNNHFWYQILEPHTRLADAVYLGSSISRTLVRHQRKIENFRVEDNLSMVTTIGVPQQQLNGRPVSAALIIGFRSEDILGKL